MAHIIQSMAFSYTEIEMRAGLLVVVMLMGVVAGEAWILPPAAMRSDHWGVNLTTTEMIDEMGYPTEIHQLTTEDGYILELHRIPYGVAGPSSDRPPIFLQHGILGSSADWIMNTVDEALGYILADAGYDVWLGNVRGNTYSRSHITLSPDDDLSYWNFNWDEMAYYDLPASLDYVLEKTGVNDLYYVGYSMGTTIFYAMLSEKPEYNDKVKVAINMAPVAFVENIKGPLKELAPFSDELDTVLTLLGVGEFLPSNEVMDNLAVNYCDEELQSAEVCYNILFLICGPDIDELNKEYLPTILTHMPAGTSVHTVTHYGQEIMSGKFVKYDYGRLGNLNHYGQDEPPLYSLANVNVPVALFHSDNDWLADPQDVARLEAELPNVIRSHRVNFTNFNHLDFVWAIHVREYVYNHVLEVLSQY